jgi:NAD(P)H-flavin reductase
MDTNHRGGPPGFVRVISNDANQCSLVYPEYSGNRLYQTLGNLMTTPRAGLVFPDFDTGDVLYITGTAEILVGEDANELLPRSNLAVEITIEAARYVENGLAFKGIPGELSPYNPPVRLLINEQKNVIPSTESPLYAEFVQKDILSPSIARFRFRIKNLSGSNKARWRPGQYVALNFETELDIGYSHMRDDDPKSLNDDFLRTFTVSSPVKEGDKFDEFEITIRKVGNATTHLFRHNTRTQLEIPVMGFGGEFIIEQGKGELITFVAGGVGITPLLAQAPDLDLERLHLLWTVRAEDLGLVLDTLGKNPSLGKSTRLFVTGNVGDAAEKKIEQAKTLEASVVTRRLNKDDFGDAGQKVYICTGPDLRTKLLEWLAGKTVLFEDFNY